MCPWIPFADPPPQVGALPPFVDVGCPLSNPPATYDGIAYYVYWVGSDGSLWRCGDAVGYSWEKVPGPPGTPTRVAVSANGTILCVTKDPAAYYLGSGIPYIDAPWQELNFLPNCNPFDVCVAADGSVWVVMTSGQLWVYRTDEKSFYYEESPLLAVAGCSEPASDTDAGGAWGIVGNAADATTGGSIIFINHAPYLQPPGGGTYIGNVVDISTSPNWLWMVKTDGSVWQTQNGTTATHLAPIKGQDGDFLAQRISGSPEMTGDGTDLAVAVGKDGKPYYWY